MASALEQTVIPDSDRERRSQPMVLVAAGGGSDADSCSDAWQVNVEAPWPFLGGWAERGRG